MPARSSSALLRAEMKMTGMSPNVGFFLMARQSSKPSIQLIITSSRITSGRSTCIAEMSRSPFAAWPTSNPSSSSASVSISRVSRSSSTMMTFGLVMRGAVDPRSSAGIGTRSPVRLGIELHRLQIPAGVADEHLHAPLGVVELPRGVAREPHALGELLDGLLEGELPALEVRDHALEARHDRVIRLFSRTCRRHRGSLARL